MRCGAFIFCLTLVACGDWPDTGAPPLSRQTDDWPTLEPIAALVSAGAQSVASEEEATRLAARAEALRNRARILRGRADDADAMEALRARLAR